MKNLFSVEGRVIVITGATGILGSSMVEHFAEQGAKVVIIGRNRDAGERLEKAAREQGGEAMFLECDVLNKAMLERCYQDIIAAYGRIDVLINGAGGNQAAATVPPDKTIFDLDVDAVRQVVDLNLFWHDSSNYGVCEGYGGAEVGFYYQYSFRSCSASAYPCSGIWSS